MSHREENRVNREFNGQTGEGPGDFGVAVIAGDRGYGGGREWRKWNHDDKAISRVVVAHLVVDGGGTARSRGGWPWGDKGRRRSGLIWGELGQALA